MLALGGTGTTSSSTPNALSSSAYLAMTGTGSVPSLLAFVMSAAARSPAERCSSSLRRKNQFLSAPWTDSASAGAEARMDFTVAGKSCACEVALPARLSAVNAAKMNRFIGNPDWGATGGLQDEAM